MEILESRKVEDCFDGSAIRELRLASEISRDLILGMGEDGHIQYFEGFARPFFKIRVDGRFDVKGIEGSRTMRVHLKHPERYSLADLREFLRSLQG